MLPEARLELAPLIDVVFVLLTFFILAMVVSTRFDVTDLVLPEARAGSTPVEGASSSLLITLSADGALTLDGATVELTALSGRLDELLALSPEANLIVAPDRAAPSGDLLALLDELSAGGHADVRVLRAPNAGAGAAGDSSQPAQPAPSAPSP